MMTPEMRDHGVLQQGQNIMGEIKGELGREFPAMYLAQHGLSKTLIAFVSNAKGFLAAKLTTFCWHCLGSWPRSCLSRKLHSLWMRQQPLTWKAGWPLVWHNGTLSD